MSSPTATITSTSPQAPGDLVASSEALGAAGVARLADSARAAQLEWRVLGASARAAALAAAARDLRAGRDDAIALVIREVGKPRGEATGEVDRAVAILEYYAQAAFAPSGELFPPSTGGLLYTVRRPHGLAGLITPWNFPIAIPLWKAAPALICGNAVLLKPSPDALGNALALQRLLAPHLPEGLFAVAAGDAEAGEAVVELADVVSFTGSVAVGSAVIAAAAAQGTPVQAEMGGQNAAIVLPDVDATATATLVAAAAMGYAGQKCTATRRVIVVGDNEPFVEALVEAVRGLTPDAPERARVTVGPVISEKARDKVIAAAGSAANGGGRVLVGGAASDRDGWFVEPALVEGVGPDHPLLQEETFGPLAAIHRVDSLDEAVAAANGVRFGLVTSLHGRDIDALLRGVEALDTGMIKVNMPTTGVDFYAPFGGEKESSYGPREQGRAALDFYTATRTVSVAPHGA